VKRPLNAVLIAILLSACSVFGLSKAEALAIAREAAPQSADYPVFVAEAGPASEWAADPRFPEDVPGDRWVWYVVLDTGALSGEGSIIVIDYIDGRVYDVVDITH
jgi:hypothetical protein